MNHYTYEQLIESKQYSEEEIKKSVLIMHPKSPKNIYIPDNINLIFQEGSNFTKLSNPITDERWNEFVNSEWLYMAYRVNNLDAKKQIAEICKDREKLAQIRENFDFDLNIVNRIEYMRKVLKKKFEANPGLDSKLQSTRPHQIIEYTFWGDTTFWIDQMTRTGANILGKLLMELRDNN